MEDVSNFCPAIAVPITVKMPEPMTAPIPSAVRDQGPSVFLRRCSGSSELAINLSIDFLAKSWLGRAKLPVRDRDAHTDFNGSRRIGQGESPCLCGTL